MGYLVSIFTHFQSNPSVREEAIREPAVHPTRIHS